MVRWPCRTSHANRTLSLICLHWWRLEPRRSSSITHLSRQYLAIHIARLDTCDSIVQVSPSRPSSIAPRITLEEMKSKDAALSHAERCHVAGRSFRILGLFQQPLCFFVDHQSRLISRYTAEIYKENNSCPSSPLLYTTKIRKLRYAGISVLLKPA